MRIKVCESLVTVREILVPSETTPGQVYKVSAYTLFNEPVCECRGYEFRGDCKHRQAIIASTCTFMDDNQESTITQCPRCGSRVVDFETEPEYV